MQNPHSATFVGKSFFAAVFVAVLYASAISFSSPVHAQSFTVLHDFTGGPDGDLPYAGLTIDGAENLEGTTASGGAANLGTVFKLTRNGSNWIVSPLYSFAGGHDGDSPMARVIVGPDGNLYGTTISGGEGNCLYDHPGCGTVFKLSPPATICRTVLCPWTETVLYRFTGGADGAQPGAGDLLFDSQGNIYGTTESGGASNQGTVYKLTRSGGTWMESVLYSFTGVGDGAGPVAGVITDRAGNLYGTTYAGGGRQAGTVFELSPSGSGWTEKNLYAFQSQQDGGGPTAGVIFDRLGNLYGATSYGGPNQGGTVFELMPSGDSWAYSVLYSFTELSDLGGPGSSLIIDQSGSLYGTTEGWIDGNDAGSVFKLTPSGDAWNYTLLHRFDFTDGATPVGGVIFDSSGTLYGTTYLGGTEAPGVVWKITQ